MSKVIFVNGQNVELAASAQTSGTGYLNVPDLAGATVSLVCTTLAQTLTNKTITGGSHTALTALGLRSTGAAFDLTLATAEVLTAGRTLSFVVGDAARTLSLSGSPSLSGITTTGTGTLATTAGKTLTFSNTLTLAGTDGSTLNIGAGGTLGTGAFAAAFNPAIPGAIGGTTPASGEFTTLSATSTTQNGAIVSATSTTSAGTNDLSTLVVKAGAGNNYVNVAINLRARGATGGAGSHGNAYFGSTGDGTFNFSGNGGSTKLNVCNGNGPNDAVGGGVTLTGAGNITHGGKLIHAPDALAPAYNAGGAVSLTATSTALAVNGSNALTLADGTHGQIKIIVVTAVAAVGTATLTPDTTPYTSYTYIAFTNIGDSVTLQFFAGAGWCIIGYYGAVPT